MGRFCNRGGQAKSGPGKWGASQSYGKNVVRVLKLYGKWLPKVTRRSYQNLLTYHRLAGHSFGAEILLQNC